MPSLRSRTLLASGRFSLLIVASQVVACSPASKDEGAGPFAAAGGAAPGAGGAGAGGFTAPGTTGSGGVTDIPITFDSGPPPPPLNSGGTTGAGGTTSVPLPPNPADQPVVVEENPGNLDAPTQQALQAGGGTPPRVLYPYDQTVFPVGLPAPTYQWENPSSADAVYVHMKSRLFEYRGYFAANANARLTLPQGAWDQAGVQSKGSSDPLTVELTVRSGGVVSGPAVQTILIARGKLKGDLFYNTYTSPQAGANGAVMKLVLGDTRPSALLTLPGIAPLGPCWSCHSLSANGAMLVAQRHQYPGGPYSSASFDLAANPGLNPPTLQTLQSSTAELGLGAVYPDGSKVLTMGSPGNSSGPLLFPDAPGNVPAMIGPILSKLVDARTGQTLPMNGWTVQYAKMPSFSPDGTLVAFNWHEDSNGHTLAVANFDNATNTFSNVRVVYKHPTLYPGWPFITPDNQEIVFALGNAQDYVSSYPGRPILAQSDLYTVDIASGDARPLSRANGYTGPSGGTYLPRPGRDEHLQFFPTLSPIAAGGYFWVFFTSRRTYGNTITQIADDAPTKKIWVSAFNIRSGGVIPDPSHPAFYLEGQEPEAGNIRAFAALEPCRADGSGCETGVDCCGGSCWEGKCQEPPPPPPPPPGEPPPPPRCANLDDRCRDASECCDPEAQCVGYYCTIIEPPR